MKRTQNIFGFALKCYVAGILGLTSFALLSGAAYAPLLLKPQIVPAALFEKTAVVMPVTSAPEKPVLRTRRSKSSLAQRLNNSYQVGRSLYTSA